MNSTRLDNFPTPDGSPSKSILFEFTYSFFSLDSLQMADCISHQTGGGKETRLATSHQIYKCKLNDNTINVMKRYLLHMHKSTFKAKQHLISATFLCLALYGSEGLTGRDVSWFLERLRVSSLVHWSMHSDSSDIWLLLRFSRLRLAQRIQAFWYPSQIITGQVHVYTETHKIHYKWSNSSYWYRCLLYRAQ